MQTHIRGSEGNLSLQQHPTPTVLRVSRADAYQGVVKGRWALLELGRLRPDIMDSGVKQWNAEKFGDEDGRLKMPLSHSTQVCTPTCGPMTAATLCQDCCPCRALLAHS